jgi:adenine-specific DNA-methyltransferase
VRPFTTIFPSKQGKPGHILASPESASLLTPAGRYVLLKRFTAKEERRRLVAGIFEASDSYSEQVGLENHLNYLYKPAGELTPNEALGLAAYFNSRLIDQYFRAISGNTQVNAAEIRAMPMPPVESIREIGVCLAAKNNRDPDTVDQVVGELIGLPSDLVHEICEATL